MKRHLSLIWLVFLCGVLAVVTNCATSGTAKRSRAVQLHASTHQLLVAVREAEWAVCQPVPATKYTECTSPRAAQVGLTNTLHQQFNGHLNDAFTLEKKINLALTAWRAGDPAPKEVSEIVMVATEIVQQAKRFTGDAGARILDQALKALAAVQQILEIFAPVPATAPAAREGSR